ncbi:MAG TPA: UDP-N-acetylmuramoyl-tripeptide--D-alanyl-D-alanine ligase [Roseiflexaceae bacterium]|nr:UDP-N-acetylmuramoyl-tripeptide--D-alanyl-D-alanine ligase [Roseiflexaceae bacterium]
MFDLEEVLLGVQNPEHRRTPVIPEALQAVAFSEAVIDSRLATPGALFVALEGERVDGHSFLADAAKRGARAALVSREKVADFTLEQPYVLLDPAAGMPAPEGVGPKTLLLITVDDPLGSLHRLASFHRERFAPKVVGITGSVGKTSTKEATAAVLSRRYRTLKNPRSYNSESTLPIVLLQLNGNHEVAVLEMGMYRPGDIALLARLARPDVGIVTNVGPSHLERAGSVEAIAAAKAELVEALPPEGYAILNYDDPLVRAMAARTRARPFFYGLDPAADLWADNIESRGLEGISFQAHHAGDDVVLNLPLIGRHSVHTALASAAAGLLLGLGWDAIVDGLHDEQAQLRLLAVPGINESMLIDDTYNASPTSSFAALNLLSELDGRHIAIMGDMLELGSMEEEAHRMVGARAAQVVDLLVTVGTRARWIAEEAVQAGLASNQVLHAASNAEAAAIIKPLIQPGDNILIKGSRGMAMESIVGALQRPPD